MSQPDRDPDCAVCQLNAGEKPIPGGVIFTNDMWLLRHNPPPYGLAGWMMLHTQRHVGGPADFTDAEAAIFGPALRHFHHVLREVTGALRIYMAGFGESSPHVHLHMIPRYATMPNDLVAWGVADLLRLTASGEITIDPTDVGRITTAYRDALAANPPPG